MAYTLDTPYGRASLSADQFVRMMRVKPLPPERMNVLRAIVAIGPATPTVLGRYTSKSAANIAQLVGALIYGGLVYHSADEGRYGATPLGRAVVEVEKCLASQ